MSASSVICSEFECCLPHIAPTVVFYFHFRPYQTVPLTIKKNAKSEDKHLNLFDFCFFVSIVTLSIFHLLEVFFICFTFYFVNGRDCALKTNSGIYIIYIEGKLSFKNLDCDLHHCTLSILNCERRCYLLIRFASCYVKLHHSLYVGGYFPLDLPSVVRFMLKIFL